MDPEAKAGLTRPQTRNRSYDARLRLQHAGGGNQLQWFTGNLILIPIHVVQYPGHLLDPTVVLPVLRVPPTANSSLKIETF